MSHCSYWRSFVRSTLPGAVWAGGVDQDVRGACFASARPGARWPTLVERSSRWLARPGSMPSTTSRMCSQASSSRRLSSGQDRSAGTRERRWPSTPASPLSPPGPATLAARGSGPPDQREHKQTNSFVPAMPQQLSRHLPRPARRRGNGRHRQTLGFMSPSEAL